MALPAPVRKSRNLLSEPYALSTWSNLTCRAKGGCQDQDYCASAVMDQIVADGGSSFPVLISQITDSRWIAETVYDYWPRIHTGELAHLILAGLFLDDTWQKNTTPALFPTEACSEPAWVCWDTFGKAHRLRNIQARWMEFCKVNQGKICWDEKTRCFRLSNARIDNFKYWAELRMPA